MTRNAESRDGITPNAAHRFAARPGQDATSEGSGKAAAGAAADAAGAQLPGAHRRSMSATSSARTGLLR